MHDPKFEKAVQEKMEELSFVPSDAVWQEVERAVCGERKRRAAPLWLLLLVIAGLAGSVAVYYWRGGSGSGAGEKLAGETGGRGLGTEAGKRGAASGDGKTSAVAGDAKIGQGTKDGEMEVATGNEKMGAAAGNGNTGTVIGDRGARKTAGEAEKHAVRDGTGKNGDAGMKADMGRGQQAAGPDREGERLATEKEDGSVGRADWDEGPAERKKDGAVEVAGLREPQRVAGPGLIRVASPGGRIGAPAPVADKGAVVRLSRPKRPWQIGYVFGGGASFLNRGLLERYSIVSSDYQGNPTASSSATVHSYQTNMRPGPSFFAGVDLQKGLRKDLALELGLTFRYYSSRIPTGSKIVATASNLSTTNGINYVNNSNAVYPSSYYNEGNSMVYTNRYYFLELPASLHWQIGRNALRPLFLDGGVNLSYLLGSNALYYNSKTGIYYKDASYVNKTQVNVFAGVMMGLPIRGIRLQAGPQLQYGLTELSRGGSGNSGQHILYGGIKLLYMPGRSHKKVIRTP